MEHSYTVSAKEAGERIDKYLCRKLPKLSRKQIKSLLDGGRVSVNHRRVVIAGWELIDSDEIEVRIPLRFESPGEVLEAEAKGAARRKPKIEHEDSAKIGSSIDRFLARQKQRKSKPPDEGRRKKGKRAEKGEGRPRDDRLKVYHMDRDIIIVEKPAGILAIPREGDRKKMSLQKQVRGFLRRKFKESKQSFIAPLHRLDVETSGIMVFALSKTGQKLSSQFKTHRIERAYQAVVVGRMEKENGVIDKPLEKGKFSHGRKTRPSKDGRTAITEYRVKERYKDATLLEIRVRTGRTHQIRVHLESIGHPIVGDALYAKNKTPKAVGELGFKRHALHAHSLAFKHPADGKKIAHRSPLPDDMKELLDGLRESV